MSPSSAKGQDHSECVHGASEGTAALNARRAAAYSAFADLLGKTDLSTHDLVWSGDCPVCAPLNGTAYPDSWTTPPPLHHNCDCVIDVQPKAK